MASSRPDVRPVLHTVLALGASLGVHVALAGLMLGTAAWRGWQLTKTVDIELVSTQVKEVKQLPFGPPPPPPGQAPAPAPRRPRPRPTANDGVKLAADGGTADAGAPRDAGGDVPGDARGDAGADARVGGDASPDARGPRPRDLRKYGPEGSRLTAILRLDRLRDGPEARQTIAAVDRLLVNLPDRRRLLDGTDLDLYRDFDAILIATPNPLDDAVTFLAARHKLTDEKLMQALSKGAQSVGRPMTWRTEGGRPVGIRRARRERGPDSDAVPALERDDRILVLPQPGLAVMAPPAYAALLLPDKRAGAQPSEARWSELIARIDDEGGAMPEDAVLMMTAANLVGGRRRSAEPEPAQLSGPGGLKLPEFATVVVGTAPQPFLQADGEFDRPTDARRWFEQWPGLKQQALANPLLLLSGLSGVVSAAEVSREGSTLTLRTTTSPTQMRQILMFIANLLPGARRH